MFICCRRVDNKMTVCGRFVRIHNTAPLQQTLVDLILNPQIRAIPVVILIMADGLSHEFELGKEILCKLDAKDVLPNINCTQVTETARKCRVLSLDL